MHAWSGKFVIEDADEDIHMANERRLGMHVRDARTEGARVPHVRSMAHFLRHGDVCVCVSSGVDWRRGGQATHGAFTERSSGHRYPSLA